MSTVEDPPPDGFVDARPEKRFFVEMLTRDIEFAPAVIDLVDNSVDGAKRLRGVSGTDGQPTFAGLRVDLFLASDRFEISDNCGGFSRQVATEYAFRFGRAAGQPTSEGEVGQFGVDMKRALFKLGSAFTVESQHAGDRWKVEVDVPRWLEPDAPWVFPIKGDGSGGDDGTLLRAESLLASASSRFGREAFLSRVTSEIAMRHAIALEQGLTITVNGRPLTPRPAQLLQSDIVKPLTYLEEIAVEDGAVNGGGAPLSMRLYAGLTTLDEEENEDEVDTDEPTLFTGHDAAGWYVFCNDRALVFADRSRLTGWGEEAPRYHPQYRRFRGFVYLNGDSRAMPWNTTKTDVDEDSVVWQQVRRNIVDALRKSITVMNRIKREVQRMPPDQRPLVTALAAARPSSVEALEPHRTWVVPEPPLKVVDQTTKISYSIATAVFQRAAAELETEKPSEVGQRTFGYWMRREVDRDFDG
jgi:hypothetical protein